MGSADLAVGVDARRSPPATSMSDRARQGERARETLTIESRLGELVRVGCWIGDVLGSWGLSHRTTFAVDLVVTEALTNVIGYAFDDELVHSISVSLADTGDRVLVEILDDGGAFDPFAAPPAELGQGLAEARIGGLGIGLMKSFADEYGYRRVADTNRLSVWIAKLP